jgi:polyisoprenoid-binding protein YceI
MKKIFTLLLTGIVFSAFTLADLKPADTDGAVTFSIKNFGISTKGEVKGLKGTIKWDAQNPSASIINVSVDINTINTGIDLRDSHLKKEEYFNAEKYPTINFVSTSVSPGNITGDLSIKGTTRPISFPFTVTPSGNGYLFEGSFTINRKDFGVGGGSISLSNAATVTLKILAKP